MPQLVETVYSRGIYPFFTKTLGRISAALPFSLAEALCYLLFLCVLFFLGYIVQAFFRPQGERLTAICRRILAFASLLCSLYTMFIFFWGFNYARMPLAASLGVVHRRLYGRRAFRALSGPDRHLQCSARAG